MTPLNDDLMRAMRRFDAAGRPMYRETTHSLAPRARGTTLPTVLRRALWHCTVVLAKWVPDWPFGNGATLTQRQMGGIAPPLLTVWSSVSALLR